MLQLFGYFKELTKTRMNDELQRKTYISRLAKFYRLHFHKHVMFIKISYDTKAMWVHIAKYILWWTIPSHQFLSLLVFIFFFFQFLFKLSKNILFYCNYKLFHVLTIQIITKMLIQKVKYLIAKKVTKIFHRKIQNHFQQNWKNVKSTWKVCFQKLSMFIKRSHNL